MPETFKGAAIDFYALAISSPEDAIAKYINDDFKWINPMPDSIPFGGTYIGASGLVEYFMALQAAIEMSPLHFDRFVSEGNVVTAIGLEENTKVKLTGKIYSMPFVHVLDFKEDGKLLQLREYNDISEMLSAFAPTKINTSTNTTALSRESVFNEKKGEFNE